jgi:phosphoglycerate dehydrogenase-like enzyme
MHRLWFERGLPSHLSGLVSGRAEPLGPTPPNDPLASAVGADGAIASSLLRYDASVFDRMPKLRVVSRTGIGYDRVDVAEATRRGIAVGVAPDGPTTSTAEHTLALILAAAKRLKVAEAMLREGPGDYFSRNDGVEIAGRTLGVVGYGRIGSRVAAMAGGLGMRVLVFDPFAMPSESGIETAGSLHELLANSDVVTLHLPLVDTTRHLLDGPAFAAMRPGAIVINTARGGLIDHDALLEALSTGHLAGAGLDVTEPEPLPEAHPLLRRVDVIVTPHVAAATREGKDRLYSMAIDQAIAVLDGQSAPNIVNPEVIAQGGAE